MGMPLIGHWPVAVLVPSRNLTTNVRAMTGSASPILRLPRLPHKEGYNVQALPLTYQRTARLDLSQAQRSLEVCRGKRLPFPVLADKRLYRDASIQVRQQKIYPKRERERERKHPHHAPPLTGSLCRNDCMFRTLRRRDRHPPRLSMYFGASRVSQMWGTPCLTSSRAERLGYS